MIGRVAAPRTRVAVMPAIGRPVISESQATDLSTARKSFSVAMR